MTNLALPLWSVVNLDTLVKSGFPAAFVRTNTGVALFSAQTLADAFIQDAKAEQNYVARPIDTSRELSWFLGLLEDDDTARIHLNPGQQRQKLYQIAEIRAAIIVEADKD